MMPHNILVTGGSGYLGGTLLSRWGSADLPEYGKLFALVRTPKQEEEVAKYGAEPLTFSPRDEGAVREALVKHHITVIYFLIDAFESTSQVYFISALAEVKKSTGQDVHFLHTSGAKIFSSHAGTPTGEPILDTDPYLYDIQKQQVPPIPSMQTAINTNCTTVEQGEKFGVKTYIFVPCVVYGQGEGFGNQTSIQTVSIVKAAKGVRRVYELENTTQEPQIWPVCHILDNITLYLAILRSILNNEDPGHGRRGYYLAASGSVAWKDLYSAMAIGLANRGVIDDATVTTAKEDDVERMAVALKTEKSWVGLQLAGRCTLTAAHGKALGWKPQFPPEHILEAAADEVDLILRTL
ncbi:hypothetical protein BDV95DRAFT_124442 [Massariosphaeria phaeospora]|uniref:NAD-dependent epimerase/dehydratase domain-containing protein n=1 Tax=Massariosphaeria phaeospora TaxID=100035 RepID=A0A7C8I226_9PLEO|nr:hypothetical protein BDV95DRAFT_124442 [Massariosphaeria phaeospora]